MLAKKYSLSFVFTAFSKSAHIAGASIYNIKRASGYFSCHECYIRDIIADLPPRQQFGCKTSKKIFFESTKAQLQKHLTIAEGNFVFQKNKTEPNHPSQKASGQYCQFVSF